MAGYCPDCGNTLCICPEAVTETDQVCPAGSGTTAVESQSPFAATDPPASRAKRKGPLRISGYLRETMVRTFERYGDEMLRLRQERLDQAATAGVGPAEQTAHWMGERAAEWYELANVVRNKQTIK